MVEENINKLAENGLLGLLLALALFVIYLLYKELKMERGLRINEIKEINQSDKLFIVEIKDILTNILKIIRGEND